jgi:hypothetical protein
MAGIKKQIPSFCFIAADNDIATEQFDMSGLSNNQFRPRSVRNGVLEAMKAFVVEEDFQHHRKMAGWSRTNPRMFNEVALFPLLQPCDFLSTGYARASDGTFEMLDQLVGTDREPVRRQLCLNDIFKTENRKFFQPVAATSSE